MCGISFVELKYSGKENNYLIEFRIVLAFKVKDSSDVICNFFIRRFPSPSCKVSSAGEFSVVPFKLIHTILGRAGRVSDGECFRLITRDFHQKLPDYGVPEMQVGFQVF